MLANPDDDGNSGVCVRHELMSGADVRVMTCAGCFFRQEDSHRRALRARRVFGDQWSVVLCPSSVKKSGGGASFRTEARRPHGRALLGEVAERDSTSAFLRCAGVRRPVD
jgi:hypothetical protein